MKRSRCTKVVLLATVLTMAADGVYHVTVYGFVGDEAPVRGVLLINCITVALVGAAVIFLGWLRKRRQPTAAKTAAAGIALLTLVSILQSVDTYYNGTTAMPLDLTILLNTLSGLFWVDVTLRWAIFPAEPKRWIGSMAGWPLS